MTNEPDYFSDEDLLPGMVNVFERGRTLENVRNNAQIDANDSGLTYVVYKDRVGDWAYTEAEEYDHYDMREGDGAFEVRPQTEPEP